MLTAEYDYDDDHDEDSVQPTRKSAVRYVTMELREMASNQKRVRPPILVAVVMLVAFALPYSIGGDAYEERIGDDFVENTTFRFRTKFNRAYLETPPNEFKALISHKTDIPPLLDGILEDECWKIADHTKTAFVHWGTKTVVRKQTVIYVCHDDKNLYLACVCEEPRLKSLRMLSHHPAGRKSWTTAGQGDCIQQFLELGGVGGTGRVFQFIFNAHPDVRYDGLYPPYVPFIETGYKLGGSLGGKRWICEIAYPCDGFQTEKAPNIHYTYEGPPRRGEIWGMRFMRLGPKYGSTAERAISCWNYNPTASHVVPYPTGLIVFEDRNALHNGKVNEIDPKTNRPAHWKLAKTGKAAEGSLYFDEQAGHGMLRVKLLSADDSIQVTQKAGVLPNVGYKLKARLQKQEGEAKVTIGVDKPLLEHELTKVGEWESCEVDFFTEPIQRELTVFVNVTGGSGTVAIDRISLEQQVYGAPAGAVCLTGNSPRIDLNLDKKLLEKVKYTYREPGTDRERFPFRKRWSPGWINGMPDIGGTGRWIPAGEGSLTQLEGQKDMVEWSHPRPTGASRNPYPKGHDVVFDLGGEYYIRRVELLPISVINSINVSVRAEGSDEYILTRKLRGAGVLNPPGPVLFGRLARINSVGRYVKVHFLPLGKAGHGIFFIRIWGEHKGERSGIRRFRWKEGLVVPEVKHQQFSKVEGPVLMPTPQEAEWGDGEFTVTDGVPVYYQPGGRGAGIRRLLVGEVQAMFGIQLRAIAETGKETAADARGAIVIGEPSADGLAARLARERGWDVNAERPGNQGYFLSAKPDGILICGFDQAGTFYGVQTLLQLLVRRDFSTAAARSVEIRDWPYIPWRMMHFRAPGTPTTAFIRAFARMKANVIMSNTGGGQTAKLCDDCFIFCPSTWAGHSSGPIEMNDDENWYHLGMGPASYHRVNACPSHLQRYEFYERSARGATSGGVREVNINTDEMDGTDGGSRWNADRRCLTRAMTGDELFTEMVIRAYDLCRLNGMKMAMLDTMLVAGFEGGNGAYYDMYKAYDRVPEDIHIYSWKGFTGHLESNPEEAIRRFERVTCLQGGFPFQHRGKVNQAYHAPPGRRVWGIWNTVWGIAGPTDQVLTGQFCRHMRCVDGGCVISFMTQAWNPDSPPVHTREWALKTGHLQQRLGEIALERELPSWRDGVKKDFFKIDVRKACNWSHIDPVPGDRKDWLDWGPNNDLCRLPRGDVRFEEVPFHVIEPETNGGKSIVSVACQPENARLKMPKRSVEIPVGRKAASLVFLRTNLGGGHHPGYRITYEGGKFLTIPLDAMGNGSKSYSCYGLYGPGQTSSAPDRKDVHFRSARHRMVNYFSLFFRLAWLGTTGCGDPVKVTMHEWVNPYPELTIGSVSIRCPPGRQSGRVEVLFAVTAVAQTQRDLELWQDRERLPLVPPNEVEIEPTDMPVIPADGTWAEEKGPPKVYRDADGAPVCEVTGFFSYDKGINNSNFFKRRDNSYLGNGGRVKLAYPQVCKKVALRGLFYWENHSVKPHYGVTMFRRTDYIIEISPDGKTWQPVGSRQGICGEDGAHVHPLPSIPIHSIRVKLNGKPYFTQRTWGYSCGPGLTWLQLYK